jgi:hypothetical protein
MVCLFPTRKGVYVDVDYWSRVDYTRAFISKRLFISLVLLISIWALCKGVKESNDNAYNRASAPHNH